MVAGALQPRAVLSTVSLVVAGLIAGSVAVRLYQQQRRDAGSAYTDLLRPYLRLCVVFAAGITAVGLLQTQFANSRDFGVALSFVLFLPWTVFALNFVGRGHLLTPRRRYAGAAFVGLLAVEVVAGSAPGSPVSLLASVLVLLVLAVVFTVIGLVILSAYRHRKRPLRSGVAATLPAVEIIIGVQLTRPSMPLFNDAVWAVTALSIAVTLVVAATHYDVLRMHLGAGTAGERAAVREMDEAVITVERDGTLARLNDAAAGLFGQQLSDNSVAEVLGADLSNLTDRDTVECWTEAGRREFDPRVTEMTNDYGEVYGYTVILIDVTDRNIRRQRIEVLNRILRHNIRNSLDVIKANVESLDDEERERSILDATDTLEELSGSARRIEKLMRQPRDQRPSAEVGAVVERVIRDISETYPAASVSVTPADEPRSVDAEVARFALRNVVENAVVHNDSDQVRVAIRMVSTETGSRVIVADNGPGIPEAERAVIENETESAHAHTTGIGLWGTNWAVTRLGGDLSFRDSDLGGTAVSVEFPASSDTIASGR
jgi:signal transduction histidine kinase